MVRKGPVKKRDEAFVRGRLVIARGFLKDARNLASLLEQKDEVQYGSCAKTRGDADRALERLEDYVDRAERIIAE